jgi:hypothetical protein
MPKINRKLTEVEIRNAKPKDKAYKLHDEGGLILLVRPSGTKVWQYPYKLFGKHNGNHKFINNNLLTRNQLA